MIGFLSSQEDDLQPPCDVEPHSTTTTLSAENRSRTTSVSRPRRRRGGTESTGERLSWLDLPTSAAASLPLVQLTEEKEEVAAVAGKCPPTHPVTTATDAAFSHRLLSFPEKLPDETENQNNHLKADRLSPAGQSRHRDFRASFMRRCQNEQVNEKVHLLRILSSTLKVSLNVKLQIRTG